MTRIKICGNTEPAGVRRAVELGVDLLGFIFTRSRRRVTAERARALIADVPEAIGRVGVFIDEPADLIAPLVEACRLTAVQLYRPLREADRALGVQLLRAIRVGGGGTDAVDELRPGDLLLVDTWTPDSDGGGSGHAWDWTLARPLNQRYPMLLSGGLQPSNVAMGIEQLRPWGVDVASGVESTPGVKDLDRLTQFVSAVREADR
jgi:phosphoribosylanthranilate isomerase